MYPCDFLCLKRSEVSEGVNVRKGEGVGKSRCMDTITRFLMVFYRCMYFFHFDSSREVEGVFYQRGDDEMGKRHVEWCLKSLFYK